MQVSSLGFRTDLALLALGGTEVTDRGDHLVLRSPHNPGHWWGNFLLLAGPPPESEARHWLDRFAAEHPDARHVALGFDGVDGTVADLAGFARLGLRVDASAVLTAREVHEPPRPNREARYRTLTSDDDWSQSVELGVACNDNGEEPVAYRQYVTAKSATQRRVVAAGEGAWFGAFLDGRLVAQMGLLVAGPGLARFQVVETHPDFRGRGLAGTLAHRVGRYGLDQLGVQTLVIVADPDYLAVRVYRSVGFADTETQLQVERRPAG